MDFVILDPTKGKEVEAVRGEKDPFSRGLSYLLAPPDHLSEVE